MMNINRHNYEKYFIDYLDGNLDVHDIAELMLFLSDNPDLDSELLGLGDVKIENRIEAFPLKNSLKKEEQSLSGTFDEDLIISKLENDISSEDLIKFNLKLENDAAFKSDVLLFEKTKLQKDNTIVFADKDSLKKKSVKLAPLANLYKYAAVLIPSLIISVLYLSSDNNNLNVNTKHSLVADNNKTEQVSKVKAEKNEGNSFKIIKTETPSIVSKSVHESDILEENNTQNVNKEDDKVIQEKIELFRPANIIKEEEFVAEVKNDNKIYSESKEENSNVSYNSFDMANNEIISDEYISGMMEQLKPVDDNQIKEKNSFGEGVASLFSSMSSVFQFEKENVEDGKTYRLALNGKNFEIGRKIKKKK